MRQGGTFETRAAHNKSHHRCGRRPGSPACPQLERRGEEERSATDPPSLRIGALVHEVHDDDDDDDDEDDDDDDDDGDDEDDDDDSTRGPAGVFHDRASRARRTIEFARPEVSSRRHIAH